MSSFDITANELIRPFRIPRKSESRPEREKVKVEETRSPLEPTVRKEEKRVKEGWNRRIVPSGEIPRKDERPSKYPKHKSPTKRKGQSSAQTSKKRRDGEDHESPMQNILSEMHIPEKRTDDLSGSQSPESWQKGPPAEILTRDNRPSLLTRDRVEKISMVTQCHTFARKGLMEAILEQKMKNGRVEPHRGHPRVRPFVSMPLDIGEPEEDQQPGPSRRGPMTPPGEGPQVPSPALKGPATPSESPPCSGSPSSSVRGRSSDRASSRVIKKKNNSPVKCVGNEKNKPGEEVLAQIAKMANVDVGQILANVSPDILTTLQSLDPGLLVATVSTVLNTIATSLTKNPQGDPAEVTSSTQIDSKKKSRGPKTQTDVNEHVVSSTNVCDQSVEMDIDSDEARSKASSPKATPEKAAVAPPPPPLPSGNYSGTSPPAPPPPFPPAPPMPPQLGAPMAFPRPPLLPALPPGTPLLAPPAPPQPPKFPPPINPKLLVASNPQLNRAPPPIIHKTKPLMQLNLSDSPLSGRAPNQSSYSTSSPLRIPPPRENDNVEDLYSQGSLGVPPSPRSNDIIGVQGRLPGSMPSNSGAPAMYIRPPGDGPMSIGSANNTPMGNHPLGNVAMRMPPPEIAMPTRMPANVPLRLNASNSAMFGDATSEGGPPLAIPSSCAPGLMNSAGAFGIPQPNQLNIIQTLISALALPKQGDNPLSNLSGINLFTGLRPQFPLMTPDQLTQSILGPLTQQCQKMQHNNNVPPRDPQIMSHREIDQERFNHDFGAPQHQVMRPPPLDMHFGLNAPPRPSFPDMHMNQGPRGHSMAPGHRGLDIGRPGPPMMPPFERYATPPPMEVFRHEPPMDYPPMIPMHDEEWRGRHMDAPWQNNAPPPVNPPFMDSRHIGPNPDYMRSHGPPPGPHLGPPPPSRFGSQSNSPGGLYRGPPPLLGAPVGPRWGSMPPRF